MTFNLGQAIGSAGNVMLGYRQAEEAERIARENQLKIEGQNRLDQLRKLQLRKLPLPEPVSNVPDLSANLGQPMEVLDVPVEPAAAPAAPAAPRAGLATSRPVASTGTAVETPTAGLRSPDELVNLPTEQLTAAEFQALPAAERARRVQFENQRRQSAIDRAALGKAPAFYADMVAGGPWNAIAHGGTWVANQIGVPRLGRALGIYDPDVTRVEIPTVGTGSGHPYFDMIRQVEAENQPVTEEQLIANLSKTQTAERTKNVAKATKEGYADWQLNAKGKPIRGLINNNPGNIRFDSKTEWVGSIGQKGGFVDFESPEAGIRAMAVNLLTYSEQRNLNTVQSIISRWAPPNENSTKGYVQKVATALGVKPTDNIDLRDPATMERLVTSIIQIENGKQPYSQEVIDRGIDAAYSRSAATSTARMTPEQAFDAPPTASRTGGVREPSDAGSTPVDRVAAQTRLDPADFYLLRGNEQAIPRDLQIAMEDRQELVRMANLYRQAGMGLEFMQVRSKVIELDRSMYYLQGMQGIQELEIAHDPRRLAIVWSDAVGKPVGIQPRTDGNYNLVMNGREVREGMSANQLADMARSSFDKAYRQQKSEQAARLSEKVQESMLKIQEGNASELANMIRETTVEGIKGNNALALEWAKANYDWDITPTGAGDGTVIIRPPNAPPYLFNPNGRTVTMDGVKIPANSAVLISGLPTPTQARLTQVR